MADVVAPTNHPEIPDSCPRREEASMAGDIYMIDTTRIQVLYGPTEARLNPNGTYTFTTQIAVCERWLPENQSDYTGGE